MSVLIKPKVRYNKYPELKDKKVLIIGGTHGIGAELAKMCEVLEADVTVVGRTLNKDLKSKQIILDAYNEDISELFKGVDYCFNNIGFYHKGTIEETSVKKFIEVIYKNLIIMYQHTRQALQGMDGGVLVNMASRPTLDKYHSWSPYTIAKQGVITLTQSASEESDTKCYAVCPSRVDTKFRDEVFPDEDKKTRLHPAVVAELVLKLFNGKNETGSYYWVKEIYA